MVQAIKLGLDSSELTIPVLSANEDENLCPFLEALNLSETDILSADQGGLDDKDFSGVQELKIELVEISVSGNPNDENNVIKQSKETSSNLFEYKTLTNSSCHVLLLPNEFFIWFRKEERDTLMRNSFKIANHIIKNFNLDQKTKWATTSEGLESVVFMS